VDQRLIFVAMMLFIVPSTAALSKNLSLSLFLFFVFFNEFNFVEIKFFEAGNETSKNSQSV